jgi:hypothetical protein
MPIRNKPFSTITLQDVESLITREIREDTTIEFKRQLNLDDRDQKAEFLKDISAMANALGGTIIYGAVEGEGDQRGQIVRVQGQMLEPDAVELQITNLLRDGLDERLDGVLFRALPIGDTGEYVCVLRIPTSPLAPHRIKYGEKPQFYARGSVSNSPLNTRQIREMIIQRATAMDNALAVVEKRTIELKSAGARRRRFLGEGLAPPDQIILHVIPLFPQTLGWRLGPDRQTRLLQVPPFGSEEPYHNPYYATEGMYSRFENEKHVLFLRGGGIEFQRYDVLSRHKTEIQPPILNAWQVELDVLRALGQCQTLTNDGLLPLPVLISLRLLAVSDSGIQRRPSRGDPPLTTHLQSDSDVIVSPFVLGSWEEVRELARHVFDEMWQAWHQPQCTNYYSDGRHHRYNFHWDVIHPDDVDQAM